MQWKWLWVLHSIRILTKMSASFFDRYLEAYLLLFKFVLKRDSQKQLFHKLKTAPFWSQKYPFNVLKMYYYYYYNIKSFFVEIPWSGNIKGNKIVTTKWPFVEKYSNHGICVMESTDDSVCWKVFIEVTSFLNSIFNVPVSV